MYPACGRQGAKPQRKGISALTSCFFVLGTLYLVLSTWYPLPYPHSEPPNTSPFFVKNNFQSSGTTNG